MSSATISTFGGAATISILLTLPGTPPSGDGDFAPGDFDSGDFATTPEE